MSRSRAVPHYEAHGSEVTPDAFAAAMDDILAHVQDTSEEALNDGVKKGIRKTAREWKANAAKAFDGTGKYAGSIHSHVDSAGESPEAHAYSDMPGLPHLLEKGHATIGGNFVPGRPHIAPAAEEGFKHTVEVIKEDLDNL